MTKTQCNATKTLQQHMSCSWSATIWGWKW